MKNLLILAGLALLFSCAQPSKTAPPTNEQIEKLLAQMTLEEKVGQLHFIIGDATATGPTQKDQPTRYDELVRAGKVTGLFNTFGAEYTARLQKIAVEESRLKIPLLFGADIIHGFRTMTPIPLAEAASWDLAAIEKSARVAAIESSAVGINWTFAPMVDIARDPRWGRMAEGAGEDPYLGSLIAAARVKGFQGNGLADPTSIAACVKHFAAYGAAEAGRDYNTVDMSERMLREIYLPPYQAGINAGAATIMSSFNEFDGIPVTGNEFLLNTILRKEWGFQGLVVSDWQSIGEMLEHGVVADSAEAAVLAMRATCDMDMMADIYLTKLPELVKSGKVKSEALDAAVRRTLKLKFDLGLFDDPYRYSKKERETSDLRSADNLAAALDIARKSIVLLKNDNQLLPLKKNLKRVAVIGPLATAKADMNGTWAFFARPDEPVTILEGIQQKLPNSQVMYAPGCNLYDNNTNLLAAAKTAAQQADVVIAVVGESAVMNGEGASRADIGLPGIQLQLLQSIVATGKPVVAVIVSGRSMELSWAAANVPALLETWTLGSTAGTAISDVLFGDFNPSGKLPVTFPRHVGQVPIFYNHKNTGRPYLGNYQEPLSERIYRSKYRDVANSPLFAFGHGLSYSRFSYSEIALSATTLTAGGSLTASVTVKNEGPYDGAEVVQLYLRDRVGSVTRPVQELKGFQKVSFQSGESKTITFTITEELLRFYRADMSFGSEPGDFDVMIGTASDNVKKATFKLQ